MKVLGLSMTNTVALFAIAMTFIPATAFAEINVINRALSVDHWKTFPWKSVANSPFWNSEEFQGFSIDEKGTTTRRFAKSKYKDKSLVLMQRLQTGQNFPKYSFVLSTREIGGCAWINNELNQKIGSPIKSFDESYNYTGTTSKRNLWYWISGKTAVVQECYTLGGDEPFVFVNFFEFDKRYIPSSAVHLTCSRKIEVAQYPGASTEVSTESEPLIITIHPYFRHILDESNELIAMDASISEKEFSFSMKNKEAGIEYKISRVTGKLSGIVKMVDNPNNYSAQIRGQCSVRDPEARKF